MIPVLGFNASYHVLINFSFFIVPQLKSHPEIYDGYVPMAYDEYLKKMSKYGFLHLAFSC